MRQILVRTRLNLSEACSSEQAVAAPPAPPAFNLSSSLAGGVAPAAGEKRVGDAPRPDAGMRVT